MLMAAHNNNNINGLKSNGVFRGAGQQTSYLVTGANRGIGKGLVAEFLLRPGSIVIACVRDPCNPSSARLQELPKADTSSLIILKVDCTVTTDASNAIQKLQETHHIAHLDVVVANAAIAANFGPMSTLKTAALAEHMQVNCYSVLQLFQATHSLLESAATARARFVLIGAPISTITDMEGCARAPLSAYGMSKLAANYVVRKLHFENKWLTAFVVDPGHVQTDMGDTGARLMGRKEAPTTLKQSVDGIIARIDEATKVASSGQFLLYKDGSKVAW